MKKKTQQPPQKPLKPLKVKISISLDSEVLKDITDLAEADDRTLSSYINKVLKDHVRCMNEPSRE